MWDTTRAYSHMTERRWWKLYLGKWKILISQNEMENYNYLFISMRLTGAWSGIIIQVEVFAINTYHHTLCYSNQLGKWKLWKLTLLYTKCWTLWLQSKRVDATDGVAGMMLMLICNKRKIRAFKVEKLWKVVGKMFVYKSLLYMYKMKKINKNITLGKTRYSLWSKWVGFWNFPTPTTTLLNISIFTFYKNGR